MSEVPSQGRFVVLEHTWNGVHWDFMLEAGESLKTWAIDEPIKAGIELPARQLADHRPAYLTYEGPVSGQRGTVRRIAEGTFRSREWGPDRVLVELRGDQLVGEVGLYRAGSDSPAGSSWKFRLGKVD
jgi:hypothetical protein